MLDLKLFDTVRDIVILNATPVRRLRVPVTLKGEPYWLDVSCCRRAFVRRLAAGDVGKIQDVANQAGVSRSTVSRFLNGHRGGWSMDTVRAILDVLDLEFDEVFTSRRRKA